MEPAAAPQVDAADPHPLHSRPKHVFILSGQSNMSGRGGVHARMWDGVVPPESRPNPSVLRFSAGSRWVEAREPLHADIDANKACGVGPGMSFANAFLQRLGSASDGGDATLVGLVPCAIGGSAISEWARGEKLYDRMVARAREAMECGGGEIKAVLWYQGESDTDTQGHADAYRANMERLIADVRADLGLPALPFIQVALASGVKVELIEQVRKAQLGIDLPSVACVDAKGLPLNEDNLHLATDAQVVLGRMLAEAYDSKFCSREIEV